MSIIMNIFYFVNIITYMILKNYSVLSHQNV